MFWNIDKVDVLGGVDVCGVLNVVCEGWVSVWVSVIVGDVDCGMYEVVETLRAGGAASSASFSKVGERSLVIGDCVGLIFVR